MNEKGKEKREIEWINGGKGREKELMKRKR